MTAEPIILPPVASEPRRPPVPFVAALVPVVAGVVLWQVTGSVLALCFSLLGPLMITGSVLDGVRQRRKERRRIMAESEAAWERVDDEIEQRLALEREALWHRHPDALHCLLEAPLRGVDPPGPSTTIVLGRGSLPSALRASGGEGDRARAARQRIRTIDDSPIAVALGAGVCIRALPPIGEAVVRALLAQLCLRFSPSQLTLCGELGEASGFAHATVGTRGAFRLAVSHDAASSPPAEATIWLLPPGSPVPLTASVVLDIVDPVTASLRSADGVQPLAVECVSHAQLGAIARRTAEWVRQDARLPERLGLAELSTAASGGLAAVIGRGMLGEMTVDLVADGPHAVVTGMTGAGKSELLVTWVSAIASVHGPDAVAFVLADFKGGTAFDPLRALPQVSAVITDLDEGEAARGVRSLTAELRRRERVLAQAGARDIDHAAVEMPRLVIVVDEFAALLQDHPDLAGVFTDIAARGRALGMHLILGTQRAAGVIRDAVAANCPLRISLRVSDAADSRLVIGSDEAALLPGGPQGRGIALVRRPQDDEALPIRVALTAAEDVDALRKRWQSEARRASPWLPALPTLLRVEELAGGQGEVLLGLADEPERQRQRVIGLRPGRDRGMAIIGGPGAGKSTAVRTLRRQDPTATTVPSEPEDAWDVVHALSPTQRGLLLCDDADRILAAFPGEYALAFAERLEPFLRSADACTPVLTMARISGVAGRLVDALPNRMLLRTSNRGEHLAAGGESSAFAADRAPGRAHLAGTEVQVAWTDELPERSSEDRSASSWCPGRRAVGIVSAGGARMRAVLAEAFPDREIRRPGEPHEESAVRGFVLIGDAEEWQREWAVLQRIRQEGEMLVAAEHPSALRVLLGHRDLPPYARTHAGRAWRVIDGGPPERVVLPGAPGAETVR
ncbi:FtsK/SpoIIIE domain-containing protein [Microbacterium sp. NPDC055903]